MLARTYHSLLALAIVSMARADGIVYSAAPIQRARGRFVKAGPAHLFRCDTNGSHIRQITSGPYDDTDPGYDEAKKVVVFWRRDPRDLIGRNWLCSTRLDGTHFRKLPNPSTTDLEVEVPTETTEEDEIPGRFSKTNGTAEAYQMSELQDGSYVYGYRWEDPSLIGFKAKGKKPKQYRAFKIVRRKRRSVKVFDESQRQSEGGAAFWIGMGKRSMLLQRVTVTDDGSESELFVLETRTGRVTRQAKGLFLLDCDAIWTKFLATTWEWGGGFDKSGAIPRQQLQFWDPIKNRSSKLGRPSTTCLGACLVPEDRAK